MLNCELNILPIYLWQNSEKGQTDPLKRTVVLARVSFPSLAAVLCPKPRFAQDRGLNLTPAASPLWTEGFPSSSGLQSCGPQLRPSVNLTITGSGLPGDSTLRFVSCFYSNCASLNLLKMFSFFCVINLTHAVLNIALERLVHMRLLTLGYVSQKWGFRYERKQGKRHLGRSTGFPLCGHFFQNVLGIVHMLIWLTKHHSWGEPGHSSKSVLCLRHRLNNRVLKMCLSVSAAVSVRTRTQGLAMSDSETLVLSPCSVLRPCNPLAPASTQNTSLMFAFSWKRARSNELNKMFINMKKERNQTHICKHSIVSLGWETEIVNNIQTMSQILWIDRKLFKSKNKLWWGKRKGRKGKEKIYL